MLMLLLIPLLSFTKLTEAETPFYKRDLFSPFDPKDTPSTFTKNEIENAKDFVPSLPDISSNYVGKQDSTIKPFLRKEDQTIKPYFGKQDPTIKPYFGNINPTINPYFGNQDPTIKPYFGKQDTTIKPLLGKQDPTIKPFLGKQNPAINPFLGRQDPTKKSFLGRQDPAINPFLVRPDPNIKPFTFVRPSSVSFSGVKSFAAEKPPSYSTPQPFPTETTFPFKTLKPISSPKPPLFPTRKPTPTKKPSPKVSVKQRVTIPPSFSVFGLKLPSTTTKNSIISDNPFNFVVVTPKPLNTFVGPVPRPPYIREPFDYDYRKTLSAELEVDDNFVGESGTANFGDNFFGESETANFNDNFFGESVTENVYGKSEEQEHPIQGNVYYYFYPVKRISQKKKSPFGFGLFGSHDDYSANEYHNHPNSVGYKEETQGAFGLFKIGLLKLILPLLLLGGFMFILSSLSIELSIGDKQRSLDNSISHSVENVQTEIEKLFENYISILDSDECLKRLFCEGAVKGKEYSIFTFLIRFFETYVPSETSKSLNIFKSAILNSKNDEGCQIFKCRLPVTHRKVFSEEKRKKQKN